MAPIIRNVMISECNRVELQELPLSLQSSSIEGCKQVESMTVSYQTCLQYLRLGDCSSAISFPGGYLPASLRKLEIWNWKKLEFPKQKHELLKSLKISRSCDSLTSFPLGAFPNLKTLQITECENLESLSFSLSQSQHDVLDELHISNCPNFVSFPREGLPAPCMTRLMVKGCNKLKSLPCDMNTLLPKLEKLFIKYCPEIDSFPVGGLPPSLKTLHISNCPNFVSFPREGLPAPCMTRFCVKRCNKLKSLPCDMNTLLPKLESLKIEDCPEIDSFPVGGLPPSLEILKIINSEKLLSNLSSMVVHEGLTHLTIGDPCVNVKSFPTEGSLPHLPSLTTLRLKGLSSVETLECKELLHLSSLQTLRIRNCPKLENMAGERLPASLIELDVSSSPLLEEQCEKKHPQIWPKISHISEIVVDGDYIT